MTLLADFGGFNDGLLLLMTPFMAAYSMLMYNQSLSADIPVKRQKK